MYLEWTSEGWGMIPSFHFPPELSQRTTLTELTGKRAIICLKDKPPLQITQSFCILQWLPVMNIKLSCMNKYHLSDKLTGKIYTS